MRIETQTNVEVLLIQDAPKLDPITVVLQDYGGGKGKLIVEVYGRAWTTFWGAMNERSLRYFLTRVVDSDYVANRLWPQKQGRRSKHEWQYLMRIVDAVRAALKAQEEQQAQANDPPAIDWVQYHLNDGSYCMHIMEGEYCGRGRAWPGHREGDPPWHAFVEGCPDPEENR